jgi:hypothetical protein
MIRLGRKDAGAGEGYRRNDRPNNLRPSWLVAPLGSSPHSRSLPLRRASLSSRRTHKRGSRWRGRCLRSRVASPADLRFVRHPSWSLAETGTSSSRASSGSHGPLPLQAERESDTRTTALPIVRAGTSIYTASHSAFTDLSIARTGGPSSRASGGASSARNRQTSSAQESRSRLST